jgi:6,7-dimethyl-8-ribityllumazine synthase
MATDPHAAPPAPVGLAPGARLGAVVSSYHAELTGAMLASAARELAAAGLGPDALVRIDAPGAFELPLIARRLALREDLDAVLCFGLVLKGETSHDRYIAAAVADALQQVALQADKPVLFGVLTCDTLEQARARALPADQGGTHDKGREVARAAVAALAALERAAGAGLERRPAGFHVAPPQEPR